jgi:hypothetical protein
MSEMKFKKCFSYKFTPPQVLPLTHSHTQNEFQYKLVLEVNIEKLSDEFYLDPYQPTTVLTSCLIHVLRNISYKK